MPYRFRVLALLFALILVMYLDRLCISVAGPRMQHDLGMTPKEYGWVIGAFTLAYALFEIPSGALGDRIGPRKVLTRIVLWWSAFTSLTGVVVSYPMLLVVRFLFGAGEAGAFPNCTVAVSRWIPERERARASSVFWLATAVGGGLTPLIVVSLERRFGWRFPFYLFGSLGLVWSAIWYWWFRDSPAEKSGVSESERALIVASTSHMQAPVEWGRLLRNGNFVRLLLMYHTYCWGAYFYLSWLPTYLQSGRGLTEDQMQIAASLPACSGVVGILAGGWLSDRLARRYSLRVARCLIGSVGLLAAGIALGGATLTANNTAAIGFLVIGVGAMDLMLPVAWSICVDMGGKYSGSVSGAMNMAGQIGSFVSAVAFGYLVEWRHSYNQALMPLAAMLIVSGILFATIDPSRELLPVEEKSEALELP
jgi:MFS transporter, ACS family, glucarate transporter